MVRIVSGVSLLLVVASCGGGSGSGTIALADFPAHLAAAQCARVFRCCTVSQIQALYGTSVTTQSACTAELTALGQALITSSVTDAQNAGRLRYDGAAAATCFEKLGSAACTATSNDPTVVSECAAYFVPLVATGGACSNDEECQTGFCDRPLASSADGACAVVPTTGMPCTSRCVAGATCDTVMGTCVDPKPDGSFCFVDEDCVSGFCDNPNITGGTCAASPGPTCCPAA
jgi:hypothetical protein